MRLYLTRHGEAGPAHIDPQKGLSREGRQSVEKLAAFLHENKTAAMSQVYHSGKARAKQTAEILAEGVSANIKQIPGINPNDSIKSFIDELESWTEDSLVVGHLPFMGGLVSSLVTGNQDETIVVFKPATMVCLEKIDNLWVINWVLSPADLFS